MNISNVLTVAQNVIGTEPIEFRKCLGSTIEHGQVIPLSMAVREGVRTARHRLVLRRQEHFREGLQGDGPRLDEDILHHLDFGRRHKSRTEEGFFRSGALPREDP